MLAFVLGAEAAGATTALAPMTLEIDCPVILKRSGRETRLLVPGANASRIATRPNPALIKLGGARP